MGGASAVDPLDPPERRHRKFAPPGFGQDQEFMALYAEGKRRARHQITFFLIGVVLIGVLLIGVRFGGWRW